METLNSIHVRADFDTVFELAADVVRWPRLLPHYRWVRTIEQDRDMLIVEMAARRGPVPVKWVSVQHQARERGAIYYRHVDGLTMGMDVQWNFVPYDDGIEVTVIHRLDLTRKLVRSGFAKWIIGEFFVKSIADRTLRHIKLLAEE